MRRTMSLFASALAMTFVLGCTGGTPISAPDTTPLDSVAYFSSKLPTLSCDSGQISYTIEPSLPRTPPIGLIDPAQCGGYIVPFARYYPPQNEPTGNPKARLRIYGVNRIMREIEFDVILQYPVVGNNLTQDARLGDSYVGYWISGGGLVQIISFSQDSSTVTGRFALELWDHVLGYKYDGYIIAGSFNQVPVVD